MEIADRLISAIRDSGDLRVAAPNLNATFVFVVRISAFLKEIDSHICSDMDVDEDEVMRSATHQSQFTQSLMLFVCFCHHLLING